MYVDPDLHFFPLLYCRDLLFHHERLGVSLFLFASFPNPILRRSMAVAMGFGISWTLYV